MAWRSRPGRAAGGPAPGPAVRPVLGPGAFGIPADLPVPVGCAVRLDPDLRQPAPGTLLGGSPPRLLRLAGAGAAALEELRGGRVASPAAGALARRLTDAGMAAPVPPPPGAPAAPPGLAVTVVVPVRDRTPELERCLRSLGRDHPVVVVDDGSAYPSTVAAACERHGAALVRRDVPGGPAAARNTALEAVAGDLVAFVDSDCRVPAGWLDRLLGHFADPLVVGVAPRVVAARPGGPRSALDLGTRPAPVGPGGRVAYVPTAAVVLRREPLGGGFDTSLRYGEDVDLAWRLRRAGWRIRYDPSVAVAHDDPASLGGRLRRRYAYGTSVGPLARRHPGDLDHLVVAPAPALAVASVLAGWPGAAAACALLTVASLARPLRRRGLPWTEVARLAALALVQGWTGVGRWCGQFAWPALPLVLAAPGGRSRRRRAARRLAACLLVLTPVLRERRRAGGPPAAWPAGVAGGLLEQAAYGAGAVAGCRRAGVAAPIVPTVRGWPLPGRR